MLVAPLLFRRPYLLQLKRAHSPEKVVKKMLVKCDLSTLIKRRVRSAYEINVYKQLVFKTMRVQKARFFFLHAFEMSCSAAELLPLCTAECRQRSICYRSVW